MRERMAMLGFLYESNEWSDHKLANELKQLACPVEMIDLAHEDIDRALDCEMLVSRIFASAVFRDHEIAHERMARLIPEAESRNIPLVNSGKAHFIEISKQTAVQELERLGLDAPSVQALGTPQELASAELSYPCIIKPNCGGRTTYTAIVRSDTERSEFLARVPELIFIVEDYIEPEQGYITRIEIVDSVPALIVKRSIADGGLSGYHVGSTYQSYEDCAQYIRDAAEQAAKGLEFIFGSFDVIENSGRAWIIDANSVSNISENLTGILQFDLMRAHAEGIARIWNKLQD